MNQRKKLFRRRKVCTKSFSSQFPNAIRGCCLVLRETTGSGQKATVAFMAPPKDLKKEAAKRKEKGGAMALGRGDSSDYIVDPKEAAGRKAEVIGNETEEEFDDFARLEKRRAGVCGAIID